MCSLVSYNSLNATLAFVVVAVTLRKLFKLLFCKQRNIQGKVVLITGATSGIGLELARLFWKAGCKVIMASRRIEQLEKVKNEIFVEKSANYFEPNILQLDLNDLQSISSKAEEALKFYGCVDILVNNAGVSYRGTVLNTSPLVDETIMKTNYFGHVVLTKQLLPQMLQRKCGDIVVINSVQGKISIPFRSAYSASKHALTAFFDCLRAELVNCNINVCVINPGYINTNLSVNALTGNGSKHGILDATTASGMSASVAAQQILSCVLNNKKEVTLAPLSVKCAIILRSLLPEVYFQIMSRRAKKTLIAEQKQE